MSLSDLLKDDENSSTWIKQRKQLVWIILIFGLCLVCLFVLGFIFYPREKEVVQTKEIQPKNVETYSELLELREAAKKLHEEVEEVAVNQNFKTVSDATKVRTTVVPRKPSQGFAPPMVDYDPGEAFQVIHYEKDLTYIPTGAVFQAKLITPIKTSVQRTFVLAETTVEYRMDEVRRIPRNSRLVGYAYLNPILKGVIVEFNRIVLPSGKEESLMALALSRNALPELEGLYFSDDLERYSTALAFGFLSGFSDAARDRETTIFGSQARPSVSNQVLSGLSTASFQVAEEILRDIRDRAVEYVVVPAGQAIFVALTDRYHVNQDDQMKVRSKP